MVNWIKACINGPWIAPSTADRQISSRRVVDSGKDAPLTRKLSTQVRKA